MCITCRKVQIALHPARQAASPVIVNRPLTSITELDELVAAANGNSDLHDLIVLGKEAGLRKREVESLKWSDVDFIFDTLTVRQSGRSEDRTVCLTSALRSALDERFARQDPLHEFVFGANPKKVVESGLRQLRMLSSSSIGREVRYCDLRQSFGQRLLLSGLSIREVMQLGGWSSSVMMHRLVSSTSTVFCPGEPSDAGENDG